MLNNLKFIHVCNFVTAPQTYSAPQPQFYDANAAAGFNAGLNTPLGGFNGGVSVGQPSSLISTAVTVVGGLLLFSMLMQVRQLEFQ